MNTKEQGFVFFDRNRYTHLYIGPDRKKRCQFLVSPGSRTIELLTKSEESTARDLTPGINIFPRCLYYLSKKQAVEKFLELYPVEDSTWRAEARRIAYEVLGKRMLRVNFENPTTHRSSYQKKDRTGLVSLADMCTELNVDPQETRKFLREHIQKPAGRWEWPEAEKNEIMKMIQGFYR